MQRISVQRCRICGCTATRPCNLCDDKTCRDVRPVVQDECIACTRPELKAKPAHLPRPRIIGKDPINMRNIIYDKKKKTFKVQVYVKSSNGCKGKVEAKYFSPNKYGSRNNALQAAMQWRDEMREIAGLPSLNPQTCELLEVSVEVETTHHIKESARFRLITNRDSLREILNRQQELQQFNERQAERERERQRVKPNHDGASRFKEEQQAWFSLVRAEGLHANNVNLYARHPKHKRIKVKL